MSTKVILEFSDCFFDFIYHDDICIMYKSAAWIILNLFILTVGFIH